MLLRSLAIWCGLLLAAFVNGAFRVTMLTPAFGDSVAHVISAVTLSAIVATVAWVAIVWLHPHTANEALLIGDEWVLLTIGFEVLAGWYFIGTSWQVLLMEYNVTQGELWVLVLVTMLVAPVASAFGHHLVRSGSAISSARKAFFGR
jgi:hypothetical protein